MKHVLIGTLERLISTSRRLLFGLGVMALFSAVAPAPAGAAGPELSVAVEAGAHELFDPAFELTGSPEIALDWPATGLSLGSKLQVPYYPDLELGELELWQEYRMALWWWWLDGVLAHSNTWIFGNSELEGTGAYKFVAFLRGVEVGLDLQTQYAPDFGLTLVPSLLYEFELMLGTTGIGVEQGIDVSAGLELADTEFLASYEADLGDYLTITGEILPAYTAEDSKWILSVGLALEWAP